MGDWLGTGSVHTAKRTFRPFTEARAFAQSLGLKSVQDWRAFACSGTLPQDIPTTPERTYKNEGWNGYGDWLGTGILSTRARIYKPFAEARAFVRALGIKSQIEWAELVRQAGLPHDIPSNPNVVYEDEGWIGYGDWLGTGRLRSKDYLPFLDAREIARGLNLKSLREWQTYSRDIGLPAGVPTNPNRTYASSGWQGWDDWLGTGKLAPHLRKYRSFEDARSFVRNLGLTNQKQWFTYCKSGSKPTDIPITPHTTYADAGWQGYGDWIGAERKRTVVTKE